MEVTQKELDGMEKKGGNCNMELDRMEKKGGNCNIFDESNKIIEMIDLFADHIEVGDNLEKHKNTTKLKD